MLGVAKNDDNEGLARSEQLFADSVRRLRLEAGLTQEQLAEEMRNADLSYANQTTVSRIEKKTRPVRLAEAEALSLIFQRSIAAMAEPSGAEAMMNAWAVNLPAAQRHLDQMKESARAFGYAQVGVATGLSEVRELFAGGDLYSPDAIEAYKAYVRWAERILAVDAMAEAQRAFEQGRSANVPFEARK